MNNAEVLCHSSGPWKKHKYFQKIGEGANAVYRYAKKAAQDPGSAIGTTQRKKWKYYEDRADVNAKAAKKMSDEWDETVKEFGGTERWGNPDTWRYTVHPATTGYKDTTVNWMSYKNKQLEQAKGYRRTATEAKRQYDKTPLGKVESIAKEKVSRGQKLIDKLFHPETKVTVETKTFSGKGSKSKKVKTNPDGSKVTIETTTYPRKKK